MTHCLWNASYGPAVINRGRLNATYFAIIRKFVRPLRELRIGKFILLYGRKTKW